MWKRHRMPNLILSTALIALLATAAAAHEPGDEDAAKPDRKGAVIGLNLGTGSAGLMLDRGDQIFESDTEPGGVAGIRLGIGVSNSFIISFDGMGYGRDTDGVDYGMGTGLLMLTWHPCGCGFFMRGGVGGGSAEISTEIAGNKLSVTKDGPAVGFGLGYEWRMGRTFAVGLAFDMRALGYEDFPLENDELVLHHSAFSVQMNWYL